MHDVQLIISNVVSPLSHMQRSVTFAPMLGVQCSHSPEQFFTTNFSKSDLFMEIISSSIDIVRFPRLFPSYGGLKIFQMPLGLVAPAASNRHASSKRHVALEIYIWRHLQSILAKLHFHHIFMTMW